MKSVLTITAVLILSCALNSNVAQAQKTSAGYDESVNFSTFKTFKFDKSGARNPFVNDLIVAAVVRELTSRGLTKVDADPDLLVVYLAGVGMDLRVANVPFYHVVNPAYSGLVGSAAQHMWDVTNGTLVIDLVDTKAERAVFRGTVVDVLQRAPSANAAADAKIVSKPINNGVAKIFKKYPIKKK
jgi:hypothetical protein